jgi:hypothetical protein
MKTTRTLLVWLLAIMMSSSTFMACSDDSPKDLNIESILVGTIDLNGATSPVDVPVNPTIVVTFNTNIDAATATAGNIKLTQDYDDADIALTLSVSGKALSITPVNNLGSGTLYSLSINAGLLNDDKQPLAATTRTFTTTGTFLPAGIIAHYTFEDNANDVVGTFDPSTSGVVDITYSAGRNTKAGKAATFNGTTSIIEVPNGDDLIKSQDLTLSFWMKTNSTGKTSGHFVMGLGAFYGLQYEVFGGYDGAKFAVRYNLSDTSSTAEDMWFPSLATDASNGGWQGWDFAKSLTVEQMTALLKDNWLQVTLTYNGTDRKGTLYYNGEKMKSFDFDLWPDGDAKRVVSGITYTGVAPEVVNEFAFGFIQSRAGTLWDAETWGGYDFAEANHFKGQLDDIKFYHKALTATEIKLMYDSEK